MATPIRTISGDDARWMTTANPGERVLCDGHFEHWVRSKDVHYRNGETWVTIRCSCGETFGGVVAAG